MLANVIMRSDLIERVYREKGVDEAFTEINSFKIMVRSALYEVRRIIYDLRPMALDDLGLVLPSENTCKPSKNIITTQKLSL
jgi:two-component system sensor histidine kinase DegS